MRHPYQCLAIATLDVPKSRQVLLAACGPRLFVYDALDGTTLAVWPVDESKCDDDGSNSSTEIITTSDEPSYRAKKRRKILKKNNGAHQDTPIAPITNLFVSVDSNFVIATTGEDKVVHVFKLESDGSLPHLSQRRMTKRPCAITMTPKNDFVLVGDKFGDVYALPLHFDESELATMQASANQNPENFVPKPFTPSATNLTVHTERNLMALKNQMRQAQMQPSKAKDTMEFPHELLLGHVSMLTDIIYVKVPSPTAQSVDREYIITSDRDEHIRVSRGIPQSYIIENYCFGHTQFVGKLCLANPELLISGGGDSQLFVWDWNKGHLLGTLPIYLAVKKLRENGNETMERLETSQVEDTTAAVRTASQQSGNGSEVPPLEEVESQVNVEERIAVCGIRAQSSQDNSSITVYCFCEAVPALFEFSFAFTKGRQITHDHIRFKTHSLPGNPLDMALLHDEIMLSIDVVHEKAMTTGRRPEMTAESPSSRLVSMKIGGESSFQPVDLGNGDGEELVEEVQFRKLKDLLYGVENLRKHGGEDAE